MTIKNIMSDNELDRASGGSNVIIDGHGTGLINPNKHATGFIKPTGVSTDHITQAVVDIEILDTPCVSFLGKGRKY